MLKQTRTNPCTVKNKAHLHKQVLYSHAMPGLALLSMIQDLRGVVVILLFVRLPSTMDVLLRPLKLLGSKIISIQTSVATPAFYKW